MSWSSPFLARPKTDEIPRSTRSRRRPYRRRRCTMEMSPGTCASTACSSQAALNDRELRDGRRLAGSLLRGTDARHGSRHGLSDRPLRQHQRLTLRLVERRSDELIEAAGAVNDAEDDRGSRLQRLVDTHAVV